MLFKPNLLVFVYNIKQLSSSVIHVVVFKIPAQLKVLNQYEVTFVFLTITLHMLT